MKKKEIMMEFKKEEEKRDKFRKMRSKRKEGEEEIKKLYKIIHENYSFHGKFINEITISSESYLHPYAEFYYKYKIGKITTGSYNLGVFESLYLNEVLENRKPLTEESKEELTEIIILCEQYGDQNYAVEVTTEGSKHDTIFTIRREGIEVFSEEKRNGFKKRGLKEEENKKQKKNIEKEEKEEEKVNGLSNYDCEVGDKVIFSNACGFIGKDTEYVIEKIEGNWFTVDGGTLISNKNVVLNVKKFTKKVNKLSDYNYEVGDTFIFSNGDGLIRKDEEYVIVKIRDNRIVFNQSCSIPIGYEFLNVKEFIKKK